jgi:hypothetical protein
MQGIDFNKSVDKHSLAIMSEVSQWRNSNIPQGDYYADKGKTLNTLSCLGIHYRQQDYSTHSISDRQEMRYQLNTRIDALKSTAAAVIDNWSIKGQAYKTIGGCIQYFNHNNQKGFGRI